jgi:ring-1,2-phenylacetyl-CoA epoxidase subunit PaaB
MQKRKQKTRRLPDVVNEFWYRTNDENAIGRSVVQYKNTHMNFIRKYYYGDIPEVKGGDISDASKELTKTDWPLWEIFIRSKQGLDHKHAGSLHAADAQMAIENARDVYTRRMEGVSIWVVESKYIHASNPEEAGSLYEPANDKVYRHPTFYDLPDEVNHM